MKKLFQRIIKESKFIILVGLIVIVRFIFTMDIPNFYIKNFALDDGLMINQMMSLNHRTFFWNLLSKNTY